jgi:hypothetical protein
LRNRIDLHKPSKANFLIDNIDDHNRDGRFFCSRSKNQSNRRYKEKKKNQTSPKNRIMGKDPYSRYRWTGDTELNAKPLTQNGSRAGRKRKKLALAGYAKSQPWLVLQDCLGSAIDRLHDSHVSAANASRGAEEQHQPKGEDHHEANGHRWVVYVEVEVFTPALLAKFLLLLDCGKIVL